MTSLYTFIELHALAVAYAQNWSEGIKMAKACFLAVLQTEILVTGMLTREERILNERRFKMVSTLQTFLMRFRHIYITANIWSRMTVILIKWPL